MKKKLLAMICGLFVLTLCGCDKKEQSITGTYKLKNNNSGDYYIKLYENGTCHLREYFEYGTPHYIEFDTDSCKYDYNENEIVITHNDSYPETCSFENNTIDCGNNDIYIKE